VAKTAKENFRCRNLGLRHELELERFARTDAYVDIGFGGAVFHGLLCGAGLWSISSGSIGKRANLGSFEV
jgi:hypothetical protein